MPSADFFLTARTNAHIHRRWARVRRAQPLLRALAVSEEAAAARWQKMADAEMAAMEKVAEEAGVPVSFPISHGWSIVVTP